MRSVFARRALKDPNAKNMAPGKTQFIASSRWGFRRGKNEMEIYNPEDENQEYLVRLKLIAYNKRMIDARKEMGWTQADLAERVGCSIPLISQAERLWRVPSFDKREKIAHTLGLETEYLFPLALVDAVQEGIFSNRVRDLRQLDIMSLTEARRAGLLPVADPEEIAINKIDRCLLKERISHALETLEPREREVIELRFGLNDHEPQELGQIGERYRLSRERIRQIECKALRKLRHPTRCRDLKDFLD